MSVLNTHSFMPTSASAAGSGTAVSISSQAHGTATTALFALGVTLLVLTAIFAVLTIRALLPRRIERLDSP